MLRFVQNETSDQFKWTFGHQLDQKNFYDPSVASQSWQQTSLPAIESGATQQITKLVLYASQTASNLPVVELDHELSILNQTENFFKSNQSQELKIYYFYQTETLTFLWILLGLILFGNCSVLVTLLLSKNRKTRMNFFIMHLAIADLTVGLVNVSTDIAWKTTVGFYAGNIACKVVKFSQVLVTYSSTYVLVSLSIDRYDAITHPLNFSGSWTRARLLVGSAWALSALFAVPAIFLNEEAWVEGRPQCWIDLEKWQWKLYITLVALSLFFIPAIIITACYSIIVYTIWTKSKLIMIPQKKRSPNKHIATGNGGCSKEHSDSAEADLKRASSRGVIPKAKIKTVKMTLVIVFVFILCWSPYFVWDLLQVYGYIPENQQSVAISTFIQSLAPLNSAANPLIYCLFSTHFCRNLRKLPLCRWFCCCFPSLQRPSRDNTRSNYTTVTSTLTRSSGRTHTPQHNRNNIPMASRTNAGHPGKSQWTKEPGSEVNGRASANTQPVGDSPKVNFCISDV